LKNFKLFAFFSVSIYRRYHYGCWLGEKKLKKIQKKFNFLVDKFSGICYNILVTLKINSRRHKKMTKRMIDNKAIETQEEGTIFYSELFTTETIAVFPETERTDSTNTTYIEGRAISATGNIINAIFTEKELATDFFKLPAERAKKNSPELYEHLKEMGRFNRENIRTVFLGQEFWETLTEGHYNFEAADGGKFKTAASCFAPTYIPELPNECFPDFYDIEIKSSSIDYTVEIRLAQTSDRSHDSMGAEDFIEWLKEKAGIDNVLYETLKEMETPEPQTMFYQDDSSKEVLALCLETEWVENGVSHYKAILRHPKMGSIRSRVATKEWVGRFHRPITAAKAEMLDIGLFQYLEESGRFSIEQKSDPETTGLRTCQHTAFYKKDTEYIAIYHETAYINDGRIMYKGAVNWSPENLFDLAAPTSISHAELRKHISVSKEEVEEHCPKLIRYLKNGNRIN